MNHMNRSSMNVVTILNIFSSVVLQGIAFATIPLFTRMLGASQYGIYALFNSWVLILTCFMGFSMSASIGTGLYTYKENYIDFRNSILLFSSIICVAEILLIFLLRKHLSHLLGFEDCIVVLIGICAMAHYIINFGQVSYIYEKKAWSNLVLSVIVSLLSVILSVILIKNYGGTSKYLGRVYGTTVSYFSISIILWLVLFLKKPSGLRKGYIKYALTLGTPIIFHTLSQQILGQSDRVMMKKFGVLNSEIGIYSLFYTLSSVLSTILGALNNSWCPFYYDDLSENNWDTIRSRSKNYIELFAVLSVGFILVSREISYLMADRSYWSGIDVIPILTYAVFFTFMYQFPVNIEFFYKKTHVIAMGTIGAGIFNILMNTLLIPIGGMYGAAFATAISYFCLFVVHCIIVTKMKDFSQKMNVGLFIPAILFLLFGTLIFYFLSSFWYIRWILGIGLGSIEFYRIVKRKSIF